MTDTKEVDVTAQAEEVQKELNGRVEQFNKELIPLLGKYELGLGASAFIQPNGSIAARPIMFDARQKEATANDTGSTGDSEKPKGNLVEA